MISFSTLSRRLLGAATLALAMVHPAAQARADIDVNVSIGQPGFYGRVNIGDRRPDVIYQQPVIIHQSPVAMVRQPIYMRVPPGHYKRWDRYCGRYQACGQRVYFVHSAPVVVRDRHRHWDRHDRHNHRGWHERRHDRHDRHHDHKHHRHDRHDHRH